IPPRESSRSRTYLPKTCGYKPRASYHADNSWRYGAPARRCIGPPVRTLYAPVMIGRRHAWTASSVFAFGLVACAVGCKRDPEIEERPVFVYSPRNCPISQSEAYSVIYASGDFEPSRDRPPIASLFLREVGRTMGDLPKETRSLVVDISEDDVDWRGLT